jgi:hypothetical protein
MQKETSAAGNNCSREHSVTENSRELVYVMHDVFLTVIPAMNIPKKVVVNKKNVQLYFDYL